MSAISVLQERIIVRGVNLAATGLTVILPALSGVHWVHGGIKLIGATFGGDGSSPHVSLGSNSSTFDNIVSAVSASQTGVDFGIDLTTDGVSRVLLTTSGLKFNVTVASTYSPHTVDLVLWGHRE